MRPLRPVRLGLPPLLLPAGQKRPTVKAWNKKRYTADEIRRRCETDDLNVGLILGPASAIDIECDSPESPADLEELFGGSIPETPSWSSKRGTHRLFAWDDRFAGLGATTKYKSVEVRLGADAKAAYSLLPPSVSDDHAREWIKPLGSVELAHLPDAVIAKILAAAEPKNASPKQKVPAIPEIPAGRTVVAADGETTGDDYCRRATWGEILEPHGWELVQQAKNVSHWRRPGKSDDGISATTGHCRSYAGRDLLFVFSSEAHPFVQNTPYSKFAAYAFLNHGGNFVPAAIALGEQGYGTMPKQSSSTSSALVALMDEAKLFRTPENEPFATVSVDGHSETYGIDSKVFKGYLEYRYFQATRKAAPTKAIAEAVGVIAARAARGRRNTRKCPYLPSRRHDLLGSLQ